MKSANPFLSQTLLLGVPKHVTAYSLKPSMNTTVFSFSALVFLVLYLASHVVHLVENHLDTKSASSTNIRSRQRRQSTSPESRFCSGDEQTMHTSSTSRHASHRSSPTGQSSTLRTTPEEFEDIDIEKEPAVAVSASGEQGVEFDEHHLLTGSGLESCTLQVGKSPQQQ